ncbi:MAG: TraB/GumN family protein [Verrucomicrobiae bacterium]|nr:TraB/GumN family protein [Verrucomicrobiae bacterium]
MKHSRLFTLLRIFPALLFSAIAALLPGLTRAQKTATNASEPAREGCVWKVSDGDSTLYLAGSVHLLREEDHPVSPAYDQAYSDSDELIFEVDMGEMTSPEGIQKMQQLGLFPPDDSLDKHLKSETIEAIRKYLGNHQSGAMLAMALPRMKPGMVFLSISSLEAMKLNARPELGLELVYFQKSQADGKPSRGLETIEFQMNLFDQMSDQEIDELLARTLTDSNEMSKVLEELIAHWHAGDAEKLDELLNKEMEQGGEKLKKLLLTGRNEAWIPQIEKALKGSKNTMVLVGAAHLVGKEGVIDLLRKKGYTVEKVKPTAAKALKKAA